MRDCLLTDNAIRRFLRNNKNDTSDGVDKYVDQKKREVELDCSSESRSDRDGEEGGVFSISDPYKSVW